ncbi:MAG: roadblock/LC7 domain-containing protein [Syntrophobacteraceae bacterium]
MSLILTADQVGRLESIIEKELLEAGADHVIIVDMAGNLILERGAWRVEDVMSLAVLSAANFAATAQIARLIGEDDFTLLFHKGDKKNIHFSRLGKDYIIITLFDDTISLGLVRLKNSRVVEMVSSVLEEEGRQPWPL